MGLGPPGLNVNLGPKGVRQTIGIPGTGVSYQTFSPWEGSHPPHPPQYNSLAPTLREADLPPSADRSASPWIKWLTICAFAFGLYYLVRPENQTGARSPAPGSVSSQPQLPQPSNGIASSTSSAQALSAAVVQEDTASLSYEEVRELQARLRGLGFDPGPVDGVAGPLTTAAIKRYQVARQRPETGLLERQLLQQARQEVAQTQSSSFEPKINIRVADPSRPIIYGTTNLPDSTELIVTIYRTESKYMAQDKVVVRNGQFRTVQFSQKSEPLNPGSYSIAISMSLAELQSPEVRKVVGAKGEKMIGALVKSGDLGPLVEFSSTFSVGTVSNSQFDAAARRQAENDLKQWIMKSCNDNIDIVNAMVRNGTIAGREITGADRDQRVARCIKEVGG